MNFFRLEIQFFPIVKVWQPCFEILLSLKGSRFLVCQSIDILSYIVYLNLF